MADLRFFGGTSNIVRFTIKNKTTGQGLTGLSSATTGLVISTICDNEASATAYTQAGATIQTIATLGTFAAPSANNCRFKEIDSTNHKGLYEFQFADARFAVASSKRMVISVNDGEATILDTDYEIELVQFNPFDTTSWANLALMYNGTGYFNATGPAQQQQVTNIAVTSAALNTVATSATYTTGTDTGGVANTKTLDGVFDSVADAAGTTDFYYQFDLSATLGSTAVGINWYGYLAGVVNTMKVYAYNWGATGWDQIGTVNGISGTLVASQDWDLTTAHTGTGGNLGLVRIRFNNTGLTASSMKTDRILVGYAVISTYQSGDSFTRLGAPTGASVSADIANIPATVFQDATAGHFTVANSFGKAVYNAFTANTSVFTVAALANAPGGTGSISGTVTTGGTGAFTDTSLAGFSLTNRFLVWLTGANKGLPNQIISQSGNTMTLDNGNVTSVNDTYVILALGIALASDYMRRSAAGDFPEPPPAGYGGSGGGGGWTD